MNYKMRAARAEKGMSQANLAKKCGVSRQTIILIEQEKFNPSLKLCISICKVLERSLNDLFWEEENDR